MIEQVDKHGRSSVNRCAFLFKNRLETLLGVKTRARKNTRCSACYCRQTSNYHSEAMIERHLETYYCPICIIFLKMSGLQSVVKNHMMT